MKRMEVRNKVHCLFLLPGHIVHHRVFRFDWTDMSHCKLGYNGNDFILDIYTLLAIWRHLQGDKLWYFWQGEHKWTISFVLCHLIWTGVGCSPWPSSSPEDPPSKNQAQNWDPNTLLIFIPPSYMAPYIKEL